MSKEQRAELEKELGDLVGDDERMILNYEIRFWRQKAWRAEQQRERAEALTEKYKDIPSERLDQLLKEIKEETCVAARNEAEKHIGVIGFSKFRKLISTCEGMNTVDDKIHFWKRIAENHTLYAPEDEEYS